MCFVVFKINKIVRLFEHCNIRRKLKSSGFRDFFLQNFFTNFSATVFMDHPVYKVKTKISSSSVKVDKLGHGSDVVAANCLVYHSCAVFDSLNLLFYFG